MPPGTLLHGGEPCFFIVSQVQVDLRFGWFAVLHPLCQGADQGYILFIRLGAYLGLPECMQEAARPHLGARDIDRLI